MLSTVPYGESDLVLSLLTREMGVVSVMAHRAKTSKRRATMFLEPIHTLRVVLTARSGAAGMMRLVSSELQLARSSLVSNLALLSSAGAVLRWLRDMLIARSPEPKVWSLLVGFLNSLDTNDGLRVDPECLRASVGLRLLFPLGYGLELSQCVSCATPCPPSRSAYVRPERGGLVCSACGGKGGVLVSESQRLQLIHASETGHPVPPEVLDVALALVDQTVRAHGR